MKTVLINILQCSPYMTTFYIMLIGIILDQSPVLADLEKYSFLKSQLYVHGVVPEVIHEKPPHEIKIKYGRENIKMGKIFRQSQALEYIPKIIRYPCDRKTRYAFILTDPDSPNRTKPVDREYLHYLVGNIPGVAVSRGVELMPYRAPLPEKGTGMHRYVFIVFQQPEGVINFEDELSLSKKSNDEGRRKFNTMQFAQKYGLGQAIAVTFFRMEWDEHYPNSTTIK